MKAKVVSLCAVLVILCVSAHGAERKKRVAVFDFDYATVRSGIAAIFGSDIDVGKGISDLLVKRLVQDGTYSVIERKAMDKILAEQNFSNSDRANPTSAARLGKLLGVEVSGRLPGSLAGAAWAVAAGVQIIRTHDVAATWQAVRLTEALRAHLR